MHEYRETYIYRDHFDYFPMKLLYCNIRGFSQEGWLCHLIEYIQQEDVDFVGRQEMIRQDFSIPKLQDLSCHKYEW